MGEIRVLDRLLADMIAAGEVVERPGSAAKELIENAIDAHATSVTVEIKSGGREYLRVCDNGDGIRKEDVPTAFLRHATSKIHEKEDLVRIRTLGFRGEALASIAAVSKVEVLTRHRSESIGTRLLIEAGNVLLCEEAGCPQGTTMIVRNLFYNVPARQKFLKSDRAEAAFVAETVDRAILSHPEVSVRYINNGKQEAFSPGSGNLLDSCITVFGREGARGLLEVDREENGCLVRGLLSSPAATRGNRAQEYFFVNGRFIKSKLLASAAEASFKERLQRGRFPVCALSLKLNPQLVDVNVHPQKTEVKFASDRQVFDAVYWACADALRKNTSAFAVALSPHRDRRVDAASEAERSPAAQKSETAVPVSSHTLAQETVGVQTEEAARQKPQRTVLREEAAPFGWPAAGEHAATQMRSYVGPDLDQPPSKAEPDGAMTSDGVQSNGEDTFAQPKGGAGWKQNDRTIRPTFDTVEQSALWELNPDAPSGDLSETSEQKAAPFAASADPSAAGGADQTRRIPNTAPDSMLDAQGIPFRLVGQVFDTYLIVEQGGEMLLIDQHAAHERINFERILKDYEAGGVYPQLYMEPVRVDLSRTELAVFEENRGFFEKAGFEAEPFGGTSILVRQAPFPQSDALVRETILEIIDSLKGGKGKTMSARQTYALYTIACKASVKGNQHLSQEEMLALCRDALRLNRMETCPHGRPIIVSFTKYFIEKQFKRG